jgi:hypothetical protein
MRFFRTASEQVYEQTRVTLDAAWGFPDAHTRSCYSPATEAVRDGQGRFLLAVDDEFCEYSVAVDLLPQLLVAGMVGEIDAATYLALANSGVVMPND